VIAMRDPNPRVNGQGIRALRRGGIEVAVGCLSDKAAALNEGYAHWVRTGRPLVILKAAMTLDGKIATASGESHWITGSEARRLVHAWRNRVDAVVVGVGTVLRDDPQLTARMVPSGRTARRRQPLRVILDSRLRIPLTARVLAPAPGASTIIVTTAASSARKRRQLEARGVRVLVLPTRQGLVSLPACFARLGRMGVTSVMIEGGAEVNASVLRSGLAHRLRLFVAPRLLGGQDAKSVIGGRSPRHLAGAIPVRNRRVRTVGADLLIEGDLAN
jgi:diaminohydroxyphosphoribosylaminopyrimidine deaminase/5-amino-6-(5-phosphoribosylamino)uracil reductase